MKRLSVLLFFLTLALSAIEAKNLKVAGIFGDNMVLQQRVQTPVWGWADAGTTITVTSSWNDKSYSAKAGKDGAWKIMIQTPEAGGPYTLTVTDEKLITFNDVYIGEVWLASGQSNMAMELKDCYESTKAILASRKSNVHFVNVPPVGSYKPLTDIKTDWVAAAPGNVGSCSAVAWYFAHFIQKNLVIPVGIINASFGGSIVETWMSRETCFALGGISVPDLGEGTTGWAANIPTTMYNGMLNPILGYGIQGCIWYQGESNVYNVTQYSDRLVAMVAEWRQKWGKDFPFYFTQIAPFDYTTWNVSSEVGEYVGAYLRDEQRIAANKIKNSGMSVILDVGEVEQIHPVRKEKVGERLGLMALAEVYGVKGFEYKSPVYDKIEVDGDKAVVYFKDSGFGLTSYGKKLMLFEVADDSRIFHPAEAYVDEERDVVVVYSKYVKNPKVVRYAFKNYVEPELFSLSGLPVSSFRTDNW